MNPTLSFKERVNNLIDHMTIDEKISQLFNISLEIKRLKIPRYDWRNECIHGVAFAGYATVFPQAIGMGASWNTELVYQVADVISTEARAKHNEAIRQNKRVRFHGLTFAAPNINIYRDPRWGRGQETFGEDPYLTSQMGIAFVKGLQGNHPKYLKTIAEPKHFAVHSGPENKRHEINIEVKEKDLWETYLPAFEACITIGKAKGIMGAYNRLNGEPCCSNSRILKEILRKQWKFDGYVIGDGGAVTDIYSGHKVVATFKEAVARALKGGCNVINPLNIMTTLKIKQYHVHVKKAIEEGLLNESSIDEALKFSFLARFRLGMFDPPDNVPYSKILVNMVNCEEHRNLASQMARESIVLLKNENNILPLPKNLESIAIIGPNADHLETLLGDYHGTPKKYVTPLQGVKNTLSSTTKIFYSKGCEHFSRDESSWQEALNMADKADVIITILGLTGQFEGEEGYVLGPLLGDRNTLDLPEVQEQLLKELISLKKPIILVLMNGGALSINFAKTNIPAIIEGWYPGEQGGNAIADVIFGNYNPSGKLPITFYKSTSDFPDFENYDMENRTYRFFKGEPLFPFGFGLSYTTFELDNLEIAPKKIKKGENIKVNVEISNTGNQLGQEVVSLYLSKIESYLNPPLRELKGFKKIQLKPGERKNVSFLLTTRKYSIINNEGKRVIEEGVFKISIGGFEPIPEYKNKILTG
ncbi:MAG: glycoside hydrolase family 3 C-terminal domain-containing protein, partial [Promethearchaeota archaeon]